jgi:hypothetical protein
MKKHWAAVVVPLLVLGCGEEDANGDGIADGVLKPDSVSVVAPATPKGTVSGQVLDTRMAPLSGASVTLLIGSDASGSQFNAQTDGAGNFMFSGVPAGSAVLITATKEGYTTLRASAEVPSNAGNIPINNGNASVGTLMLAEANTTLRFTLYTDAGRPAVGARAYLQASPAGLVAYGATAGTGTTGSAVSSVSNVVAAPVVADALGVVTFTNMPSPAELARLGGPAASATEGQYRLFVDPVDLDADGIFDAAGLDRKFTATSLLTTGTSQLVKLSLPANSDATGFVLSATNVPSLKSIVDRRPMRNLLRPGEPIFLGFSQPVARDSLLAILTDEQGREQIPLTVTANATSDVFSLTPTAGTISEGKEYNLSLRAMSAYSSAVLSIRGFFVGGEAKSPRALELVSVSFRDATGTGNQTNVLDAGECVVVTFNQVLTPSAILPDITLSTGGSDAAVGIKSLTPAPPPYSPCFGETSTKFPVDTAFGSTTRFYFVYGSAGAAGYPAINPDVVTAKLRMEFTKFQSEPLTNYFETAWGSPVPSTTLLERTLTKP